MEDINLLRDPGYGRGEDALRIIQKMQRENIRWDPESFCISNNLTVLRAQKARSSQIEIIELL